MINFDFQNPCRILFGKNQEEKVLYSIENLPMKYLSLIIKPNGCVNVVDYRGYRFIAQLNNGLPVIPKIKFYEVN